MERAEADARAWECLPAGYDPATPPATREALLRAALADRGLDWPEPPWPDVLAFLGAELPAGTFGRIQRILGLSHAVLDRCDAMGLTKNAAAAVATVGGEGRQVALLDAADAAGDPSLVTPAAGLMAGDPGLEAADAVAQVLAARRAAERARQGGAGCAAPGQIPLPRPPCPPEMFTRLTDLLGEAAEIVELYRLDAYQTGSVRLWAERIAAVGDDIHAR